MATQEPGRAVGPTGLTSLPRVEDLPIAAQGYDQDRVREALDAYRRHTLQLQAQLRVLQAAGGAARLEPSGHAVRMDALHLIRAAAEFADQLERDAQNASASQLRRAEESIRTKQREVKARDDEVERYRQESERQRAEMLGKARTEARELLAAANRDATRELQEAEARGARLLEQSRHQATELTNSARAEVEQTLEWARAQASAVMTRAQHGAEQLLSAAGLDADVMSRVVDAIVRSAEADTGRAGPPTVQALSQEASATPVLQAAPETEPGPEPAAEAADAEAADDSPDPENRLPDAEQGATKAPLSGKASAVEDDAAAAGEAREAASNAPSADEE